MKRQISVLLASLLVLGVTAAVAVAAASPSASTGAASKIKDTSAVLNGRVNPNGTDTTYWFVWGPTTAYGGISARQTAGNGTASRAVGVTASNLVPGTTYHYRLFAQNSVGTTAGTDRTFKTAGHALPGVLTGSTSGLSQSGATVSGTVVPNGQQTSWYFQYSCGTAYCQTSPGTVASSSGPLVVSQSLNGLAAGTNFYYRLVGIHAGFPIIYGAFAQFTTYPTVRPYPGMRSFAVPGRARRAPYVFQVFGSISGPFPAAGQCGGNMAIRFYAGGRQVAYRGTPVGGNCGFYWKATFRRAYGRMRIQVTFSGNGYLSPRRSSNHYVTLG